MEYAHFLRTRGYDVRVIDYDPLMTIEDLFRDMARRGIKALHLVEPSHHGLHEEIKKTEENTGVTAYTVSSPGFLTLDSWIANFFRDAKHYSMTRFYREQRKRLGIMVEHDRPMGGKWSFDPANRKRLPKDVVPPLVRYPVTRPSVTEAVRYVEKLFPGHPGSTSDFFYPVTHQDAQSWLEDFVENRLYCFGDYQDALRRDASFLFHSVLTPCLNIGLLTPEQILKVVLDHAEKNRKVPLNSLEGFVRQVIGWREFMRAVYLREGKAEMHLNFWDHKAPIPPSFYSGETGIAPVDTVIRRLKDSGYAHHIERLMVLGNFMLLCEINPQEVYRWFMEMFIDSYEWVMVPNVFGMSQYADGGLITTKPYISSSNYILKMSDYPTGEWCRIWDGLFWRFIDMHRDFFRGNVRTSLLVSHLERVDKALLKQYHTRATHFLDKLHVLS